MSSKRSLPVAGGSVSNEPPSKKALLTIFPPINLGPISTEEELDLQVVKIQNKKLYARLEEKNALEDEYKSRIAELEKIHKNDQIVISTLNLTWNRLDEDVRIMLQRFEEIPDDDLQGMSETTVEFLEKLSNRTSKGIEEEVQKRAAYSTKIASRLIKAIETSFLLSQHTLELLQESKEKAAARAVQQEESDRLEGAPSAAPGSSNHDNNDGFDVHAIELAIKLENSHLKEENSRLHALAMSLQDQHNSMSVEYTVLRDKLDTLQKELNEANTRAQDTDYDLQKANKQVEKLIKRISDMQSSGKGGGGPGGISSGPTGDKHADELELQTELAASRLTELEALQKSHVLLAEEYEKLKQQSTSVPDEVVVSTTKYKMLQTQFNILFTDAQTIRRCCEEARKIVTGNRNQHIQQIEQLESENASMRKRVRAEISQLEVALTDTRKELEQLRVEYEHNMKAHEQIGPMAKEMRHLINSLQNHNQQLKGEVQRFKRKLSEALDRVVELEKMKKESGKDEPSPDIDLLEGPDASPKSESSHSSGEGTDSDDVKFLRTKLKAARQKRKEMKLLLDMYKGVSKETRTKAELLKNEQMLREELAAQKAKLAAFTKDIAKQSRKMAEEEAQRSIKKLNDMLADKDRQIANTKQEEDALLSEMEFTGQAFEEMQEQNLRLMQQLREKDDANLKLMSEKIKANQLQKLLREEKEVLTEKISALTGQRQSSDDIVRCLEEREKVLQSAVANLEKEMTLRQQAVECHKRKAVEVGQQCQELMFKLENLTKQLDELKSSVVEKTNRLEEEMFKVNRIQEENMSLKKKLDRAKKMEYLGASDEILVEEVKMYKGKLQCPCCNTRPKDAILTKCFHVFCFECLKTRYDTRQRKCPKCNATFGNNDFHKIYM